MARQLLPLFSFFVLTLCSCSAVAPRATHELLLALENHGPVPLSPTNPHLATNLFVSREMQSSQDLKGFIEHRGAPEALAVENSLFSSLKVTFYYPQAREYFELKENASSWIISGPYMLQNEQMKRLAGLARTSARGAPTFTAAMTQTASEPSSTDKLAAQFYDDAPKARMTNPNSTHTVDLKKQQDLVIAALRERAKGDIAETTPHGDLVHHAIADSEDIALIAWWYTDDIENAPRLARINNKSIARGLRAGDQLAIPSYLVKHQEILNEEALKTLSALREQNK